MKDQVYSLTGMRITKEQPYYDLQFTMFSREMIAKFDCSYVEMGKQDVRGNYSISLFTEVHTITQQKHFASKDELFGYIVGFNSYHQAYL